MVAAAAVGGILSVGSAAYGARQARKASKAQIEAGDAASALEKESADKQLELQKQIWEYTGNIEVNVKYGLSYALSKIYVC